LPCDELDRFLHRFALLVILNKVASVMDDYRCHFFTSNSSMIGLAQESQRFG